MPVFLVSVVRPPFNFILMKPAISIELYSLYLVGPLVIFLSISQCARGLLYLLVLNHSARFLRQAVTLYYTASLSLANSNNKWDAESMRGSGSLKVLAKLRPSQIAAATRKTSSLPPLSRHLEMLLPLCRPLFLVILSRVPFQPLPKHRLCHSLWAVDAGGSHLRDLFDVAALVVKEEHRRERDVGLLMDL